MWRPATILGGTLLFIPVVGFAVECPPGTYVAEGRTNVSWGEGEPHEIWCEGGCPARWCEKKNAEGYTFRQGPFSVFYETGERYALGAYDGLTRSGHWTVWYRNGKLRLHGAWRDYEKIGHWVLWSKNGVKESDGRYVGPGYRHGHWRFWEESGRLVREGSYDHDQPVGAWDIRDEVTGELRSGELPFEQTGIPEPCGPIRVNGEMRWPPAPRIAFLHFSGAGDALSATLRISNPHDEAVCFFGFTLHDPSYGLEHWVDGKWRDDPPWRCGFGLRLVTLAPRQSTEFIVPLGNDRRPFRVRLSTSRPDYEPGATIRSKRIEIPRSERALRESAARALKEIN